MSDPRRYLSGLAVLALVLLRLAIGWHFFREGTQKVVYDPHDGDLRMKFSAEGFLSGAKGPLATWYTANVPDEHGWRDLLATPRKNTPLTEEESKEQSRWLMDYEVRRDKAKKEGQLLPVEFPKSAAYSDWAERIQGDWRKVVDDVRAIPAFSDEQKARAEKALNTRLQNLADYLATQADAIAEYRHDLWRLADWRSAPEAGNVPFVDERITTKTGEMGKASSSWIDQVKQFDEALRNDLRTLITKEQRDQALTLTALDRALEDARAGRLQLINTVVTILTIGVGICLLLGLLTRFASIVGALFLLGVILSQPPWLPTSLDTLPQVIEFTALLVLAGTAAGRWAGLDYITYALFHRPKAEA